MNNNKTAMKDPALRTIRVYGTLAKLLKRRTFQAVVRSPQEAIKFLLANFPQLKSYIEPRYFQIRAGDLIIGENELDNPIGSKDVIHITPAICGAGGDGLTNIIVGAALIVTSILIPFTAPVLLPLGIGLALTGVAQLLVPVPSVSNDANDPQARNGYVFNGVQNTSRQGVAVPCVYGEIVTGSIVLSVGIEEDEEEIETEFIGGAGDPEEPNELIFPECTEDSDCGPGFCCDTPTGKCISGNECGIVTGQTIWYRPEFYSVWGQCFTDNETLLKFCLNSTTPYREERYYTVPCGVLPIRMEVIRAPGVEFNRPQDCDFAVTSPEVRWYDANNNFLASYTWPGTVDGTLCWLGGSDGGLPYQIEVCECPPGCSQC